MKQLNKPLNFEGLGVMYIQNLEHLKMVCKILNFDYPKNEIGFPVSTKNISNKKLVEHIEFIIKLAYQNDYKLDLVEAEWRRIKNENS